MKSSKITCYNFFSSSLPILFSSLPLQGALSYQDLFYLGLKETCKRRSPVQGSITLVLFFEVAKVGYVELQSRVVL